MATTTADREKLTHSEAQRRLEESIASDPSKDRIFENVNEFLKYVDNILDRKGRQRP